MKTETRVNVSSGTIVKIVAIGGGLAFMWFIRDVVAVFFAALLLAALIDPFADWFERRRLPRALGVLVVYVLLAAIITGAFLVVVPPLVSQLSDLVKGLTTSFGDARGVLEGIITLTEKYGFAQNISESFQNLQGALSQGFSRVFSTIANVFGGVTTLVLVLVLTFYMVVEEADAKRLFRHFAPKKYQPYLVGLAGRMQEKLGYWLRGQLVLMLVIGALTYIGLLILGVDYALVLGIFAGLAEIVPYAGPILAAIPAIVLAFSISPIKAVMVAVLYFAIQQLENGVLTPKIMQKSVGLNPVVSLFALMVGFKVAGFIGAIFAIPVATLAAVLVHDLLGRYDGDQKKDS